MPMFARGSKAWGLCQRCGLQFLLADLCFDGYFKNLRVCEGCYDPPQPQEKLAIVSDPEALYRPAPDTWLVNPPFLTAAIATGQVVLNWTSISVGPNGNTGSAYLSAGYQVSRSTDGVNFTTLVTLLNTADDFGALSVEHLTYTDNPGAGTWYYRVRGYDTMENAQDG